MQAWLIQMFYKYSTHRAGLTKCSLTIEEDPPTAFSYCEKGSKINGKPSLVFVHGLSSNKETWLPIIKNIPDDYHCLTIDLPAHGETLGFQEEYYTIDKFVDRLKLFFDKKGLTDPICLIGASLGGAVVLMFALKYPEYISMLCLLAPPANEQCETELIQNMRAGSFNALLPETPEELYRMMNTLTVKEIRAPRIFINGFLHLRLRLLKEHTKVLSSLLQHDYPNLEHYYQQLKDLQHPTLVLWGREDRLFTCEGADYFCQLIPHAEKVVLEDCGHFMAIDKPEEAANTIITFFDRHHNSKMV